MTPEQRKIIEEWRRDMKLIFGAHYASAIEARRLNYWLGIPVVVLSAIVGTSVFAALDSDPSPIAKIGVGCVSMLIAVLASLQTFMKFEEQSESHREAGAKFAGLHKEIDQLLVCPPTDDQELGNWMSAFRERWDQLSLESPTTSPSTWTKRKKQLEQQERIKQRDVSQASASPGEGTSTHVSAEREQP